MKNSAPDAIELLKEDHEMVKKLFKQFKTASDADDDEKKAGIVEEITEALEAHATVEEEIFYPAVKKARSENTKDIVREAYEEHTQIKALLAALAEIEPDDESYDAKMKVLQEDVEHHVEEEEGEMFPDARKFIRKDGLQALGQQMAERKADLMPEEPEEEEDSPKRSAGKKQADRAAK
jgi:hemerythrin superfamily protein